MRIASPFEGLRPPSDREFARFRDLIERETGIYLADSKKALLTARLLQRLRELGLSDFGAYYDRVVSTEPAEAIRMLDRISTNETHFFREAHHFALLRERVLPRWAALAREGKRQRRVTAWSAGCSTGEEPYTLAMTLLDAMPPADGWHHSIFAGDLSTRALAHAEAAIYREERIAPVPLAQRRAHLLRGVGSQEGNVQIAPEVRSIVQFARHNLVVDAPPAGAFDLIFCRNVLIYFRAETRAQVVARLASRLVPGGILFLGHAETLPSVQLPLRTVIPTVFERTAEVAR